MTDPLELALREELGARATAAPEPVDLAAAAIGRARERRRRHALWGTAATLTVVLALGATALLAGRNPAATRPAPPPVAATPTPAPTSAADVVLDGTLTYRGASVRVPERWVAPDYVMCGDSPDRDVAHVVLGPPVIVDCQHLDGPDPATLSEVILAPWTDDWWADPPASGGRVLADGRTQLVTRVPAADVRLVVTSPDPELAQRIFDSLAVEPPGPCEDVWLTTSGGAAVRLDRERAVTMTVRVGDTITTTTNGRCDNMETTPQTSDDRVLTGQLVPPPDDHTRPLVLTATGPGTVRVTAATGQCDQVRQEHPECIGGIAVLGSVDVTVVAGD